MKRLKLDVEKGEWLVIKTKKKKGKKVKFKPLQCEKDYMKREMNNKILIHAVFIQRYFAVDLK